MNNQKYLDVMLQFVQEGGALALSMIHDSKPSTKMDNTIVTQADRAISKIAHRCLKEILQDPQHLLIDEEDEKVLDYLDQSRLDKAEFIWSVDPIDGTRLYANRIPTFGISIGLLRNLKPWMGVVYFPLLNELFFCDGTDAFYVRKAFSGQEERIKIIPVDQEISRQTLFYCNDNFFKRFAWNDPQFHCLIQACAVVNLLWPTIGRGCGCFFRSSLWDFAGSWPIVRCAGLDLRVVQTSQVLEKIDVHLFNRAPKPWELKEYYLLSSERNFSIIKSKIVELSLKS